MKPDAHVPFHGCFFHILKGQTGKTPGGAKEYLVKGKMTGGFAFVACPAEYRNSGVMTFMINQDGVLLQKDLGKNTAETVAVMTKFDPDPSWTIVGQERSVRALVTRYPAASNPRAARTVSFDSFGFDWFWNLIIRKLESGRFFKPDSGGLRYSGRPAR